MTRLATIARTIRDSGGVVRMRRADGCHDSPWAYLAGTEPVDAADVEALEAAGVLTRIEPGIAGCERCRFEIVDGAA
ncbi:MAG TPA: hypothetical protein VFK04_12815 [Gemmatimonadaceae bacterium]|nr:hypothetical protein [Gemmatimonadaceae bacterium]